MTVNWSEQLKHSFDLYETNSKHAVLGNIDIYQYIPDKKVKIFSKLTYVPDKEYFLQKTKFKHPSLLRALALEKCSGTCSGDQALYKVYYDYPGICTLEQIIDKKANKFSEQAIWDIIFQFVDCAEYLQSHFKTIGNINPNTIYALDDGIKIFEVNHIFQIDSSYDQALKNSTAILSPEQIEQLQRGIPFPSVNGFKSDVYAFGIVLLCLTTLSRYTKFYTPNQELDKNQIYLSLQQTKCKYSELLNGLIQKMLLDNPSERQSWIDIKSFINPFKSLEENAQPFYSDIKLCPQITKQNIPTIESVKPKDQSSQMQGPLVISPNTTPRVMQSCQQLKMVLNPPISQTYVSQSISQQNQSMQLNADSQLHSQNTPTFAITNSNQPIQNIINKRQRVSSTLQNYNSQQTSPPQSVAPNSTSAYPFYQPNSARPQQI
ncbi:unnamed protein product (macronuclear) [Paramecium tetraurelia]|uniref:Protein kinase domain-containing protein n=1 Tax=Paramecium tetraurelia TaxID=5888 RepID=A0DFQ6_PARTE|nr:uncharacterized protein GSPATT00016686001 [Paramecium tetraurelia]CAK81873.1 unnamed protein product [Paramecium tetraurelia]|eukprot:XP_001449270.1 hypothetical protein (macronuclear) [Paramecium tetraurelia strain d4-2]